MDKAKEMRIERERIHARAAPATIEDWLTFLELPELVPAFKRVGFVALEQIHGGLTDHEEGLPARWRGGGGLAEHRGVGRVDDRGGDGV